MTKRLVICFDGTWNDSDLDEQSTNVLRLYRSILGADTVGLGNTSEKPPSIETVKWYDQGVGTNWGEKLRGSLGYGLSENIRQGYKVLADHYVPGDEVYLFGFSRGAYAARSLAGFIRNVGLVNRDMPDYEKLIEEGYDIYREHDAGPDTPAAVEFRESNSWEEFKIKFVGVWDTVGALGVPIDALSSLNERYAFHDTKLSRIIENAFHAVAIDEHRKEYKSAMWNSPSKEGQTVEQVWFTGAHSDVGGGSNKPWFSNIGLWWMQDQARLAGRGLEFDPDAPQGFDEKFWTRPPSDSYKDMFWGFYSWLAGMFGGGRFLRSIGALSDGYESIHDTASQKMTRDSNYNPQNPGLR